MSHAVVTPSSSTTDTASLAISASLRGAARAVKGQVADMREMQVSDSAELAELMHEIESIKRQVHALSIDLLALSEQSGLHYVDGHTSAKVMMRHVNKLSGGEAAAREKCRRMFSRLELVAETYRAGELGTDQVMLLGRVFANPRVRGAMEHRQRWFLDLAKKLAFPRFEKRVLKWQRLIDEDGTEPPGDRTEANRTANMNQDPFDLTWDLTARFGSVRGAANNEILQAYIQVLFDADWAEARARVGDSVCKADLARTDEHRRSDALSQIFIDAATNKEGMAPLKSTHGIMWSASAYEEMARRFAGAKPQPFDIDDYCCSTIDGNPVDPYEAFADSVVNKIRRIVVDAAGVVTDMGRARSFTGLARDAVRITGRECFWIGCWVPATLCETDHTHPYQGGGRTNPGNGAPGCGRHNQWKENGYRVWRDETGQIHIQRPNGTEIE
jgi:hypothetical protein